MHSLQCAKAALLLGVYACVHKPCACMLLNLDVSMMRAYKSFKQMMATVDWLGLHVRVL